MEFYLTTNDGTPIYRQIMNQVQHMIASGRIQPGDEMPSVRALANQLLVNPNTILRAYRELETMGLVVSRQGSGTVVAGGGSPLARREKRRIMMKRVEALMAEAHQLGMSVNEVKDLIDKYEALVEPRRTA